MAEPIPKHYPNKRQKPTRKSVNRKSSAAVRRARAERRVKLRGLVVVRSDGLCEWSNCYAVGEHMAHIEGIGRGGDKTGARDTIENVMFLCVYHHDSLDGRRVLKKHDVAALLLELNLRRR